MYQKFFAKFLYSVVVLSLIFACKATPTEDYTIDKSKAGENGMVVTAHPLASEIGLKILQEGGNAADAAIAVQLALAVVYPRAGNLGGGGFLVYRDSLGEITSLDFREKAPLKAHKDMFLDSTGVYVPSLSQEGILAAGIPGTVAGLVATHEKYGSIQPFSRLVEPSIHLAEKGFRLTASEAKRLNDFQEDFKKYNGDDMPFISNSPWKTGDLLVQTALASTLKKIASHGKEGFYKGPNAEALVALSDRMNGLFTAEDLGGYEAVWRKPITNRWRDYEIHSMGLPSSGGVVLGQILSMLEDKIVDSLGYRDPTNVHLIVEAERRAYMDRATYLGDSDFFPVNVEALLAKEYLTSKFIDFNADTATSSLSIPSDKFKLSKENFETTHISITDRFGNAAAITTTLNDNYGCKVWVPIGGYFLNNEMDDFSAQPGTPNLYGLIGGEANAIAPSKRMLSSMTPTIIEKNGQLWMVLGTPGGSTIITSVLQVFLNVAAFGMDINQAVDAKRYHHQWLPDEIMVEETGFSPELEQHLTSLGHSIRHMTTIGFVEAIWIDQQGLMHGAADVRGDDHAAGW